MVMYPSVHCSEAAGIPERLKCTIIIIINI